MAATDDFVINSNGLGYIAPSSEKKHASGVQVPSGTGVKGDDTMEVRFEFGYVNMSKPVSVFELGSHFRFPCGLSILTRLGW